ncbi:hypothetical protein [Alkalihalobacterium chitinilyticum]|uniref:KTSC domain-containing protein n=1 Tax=Alkalihalobacterium chitinilyticum TaxID=2980103 RepID=A0ABT5V8L5_9BACI|nr:hypothetical protein [Alkalihalobacterium chitinilyticum]MDE5411804.1 hypothetical protein [Alkalihalobacterium chitinilyticum]
MDIYFSPELSKEDAQVLNIVDRDEKAVGYLAYIIDEKKVYVYGQLENEGVYEDFKDLVKPYLKGLQKIKEGAEVYSYLSVGGKKVELEDEKE